MHNCGAEPVELAPLCESVVAQGVGDRSVKLEYSHFIKEAFITPIRSVSVVDDEYPTLDSLLHRQDILAAKGRLEPAQQEKIHNEQLDNLRQVVSLCREPANNWMVDVYDGVPLNDEKQRGLFAQRLHHSDLLILDYHLEGEHDGRGERALRIINQLAEVDHFNLVVVHTKGYLSATGSVEPVLRDIIVTLSKKPQIPEMPPKVKSRVKDAIDDWSDTVTDIRGRLLSSISDLDFLAIVRDFDDPLADMSRESVYALNFKSLCISKPEDIELNERLLFWFILEHKNECFADLYLGDTQVDWGKDATTNWVRTEKIFITVVGKHVPARELPSQLIAALTQWDPHPHKLLMAKLRYELDDKGIVIATDIVGNEYLQAYWLDKLLGANVDALPTEAWSVLEKHWDELASRTKDSLSAFAQSIIKCLTAAKDVESIKQRYIQSKILQDPRKILAHANCFNNSKKVVGHHLTTGHVLRILAGTTPQYWLCLTPACDLVPGQKNSSLLGNHLPVRLVRLYDAKTACSVDLRRALPETEAIEAALKVATRNEMVFLDFNGSVKAFCFSSVHGKANPKWEQFYAGNNGKFSHETVTLYRVAADEHGDLSLTSINAEVAAQLRYEYALNLLQKLGATMSRVGLDFAGLRQDDDAQ